MTRVSPKDDVESFLKKVGIVIRLRRKAVPLSQEALADVAMIDRSHMGKIERGERNLSLLNLIKIAKALKCKPSEILSDAAL